MAQVWFDLRSISHNFYFPQVRIEAAAVKVILFFFLTSSIFGGGNGEIGFGGERNNLILLALSIFFLYLISSGFFKHPGGAQSVQWPTVGAP